MSKWIDCTGRFLPHICEELVYAPTKMVQSIVCVEDGEPIAGVIYDTYNTVSISAHIWVAPGKKPSREWFVAIFDYPFNRLKVSKIVGQIGQTNANALRLDKHLGFVEEARVRDFSPEGDLLIYTMTKDQCKILNSPKWSTVVDYVAKVA